MKIRRYLGKDTQEAMLKVKMDLGNEAIILNTKKVRQKGLLKVFAKPLVEVLAAVDEDYGKQQGKQAVKQENKVANTGTASPQKNNFDEKEGKISDLENKVNIIENLIKKMYDQMQAITPNKTAVKEGSNFEEEFPKVLQIFYNNLIKNEVENDIAKEIIKATSAKVGDNASINDSAAILYNIIYGMLGKPDTIRLRDDCRPTVVTFVGPTGVGKTTTLAKIAANYALNHKKSVGLITSDIYRIAAVEQLKTYAEILGMPLAVVYSIEEIKNAIREYSDKDVILIDTAGRSHSDKSQFDELKQFVAASKADEIYLVLSSTTSTRTCKEIISTYEFLKDYKLIFTKLDETPANGIILNARYITGKNLSYVATGQSVPDDLEVANIDKLTKNLLGSIT
ncbi:MAG: flagellar biosynthesis protein FlhF [Clostridia bacterium]|nr:flagellar biosynthesis protein FlhF [Clostridia bacterium]